MFAELSGAPGQGDPDEIELPPNWMGTTVHLRVTSSAGAHTHYLLGVESGGGSSPQGVYQPAPDFALVVAKNTAFWVQEDESGALRVSRATLWPVVEVLSERGCVVLVSNQRLQAWRGGQVVNSPFRALDGFRDLDLRNGTVTGSSWMGPGWEAFTWVVEGHRP